MTHEVLCTSFKDRGFPHLEALAKHNPGIPVHLSPDGTAARNRREAWRNCDRQIRDWWLQHRGTVRADRVFHIEWDVVFNADIRKVDRPDYDLAGRKIERKSSAWGWWPDVDLLPVHLQEHAQGMAPCAVLAFSRRALDEIADPRWDDLFKRDIISEIRLPTIIASAGLKLGRLPALKQNASSTRKPHPGDRPGVWHAVKYSKP